MRIGVNVNRDKYIADSDYFHQVIIPVYIPNLNEYYKDSFEILKICLQSIIYTVNAKTFVSIVSNGSCDVVNDYLIKLKKENTIHELTLVNNVGKINSVLKSIVGSDYQLVTITDADVLFQPGWQEATYQVFKNFPKAGVVCPMPNPGLNFDLTGNVLAATGTSYSISYEVVNNQDALLKFAESTNSIGLLRDKLSLKNVFIHSKGHKASLGASHFVCTYRREVFGNKVLRYTNYLLGGESEKIFLDTPVLEYDLWRLSTTDSYVYHMGNTFQSWYDEKLALCNQQIVQLPQFMLPSITIPNKLNLLFIKIKNRIYNSTRYRLYFKRKYQIPIV